MRDTIKDLGGTMPEDLPTPEKSIQQLEREQKKKFFSFREIGFRTEKEPVSYHLSKR